MIRRKSGRPGSSADLWLKKEKTLTAMYVSGEDPPPQQVKYNASLLLSSEVAPQRESLL